jgi:hypothetical protein
MFSMVDKVLFKNKGENLSLIKSENNCETAFKMYVIC